VLQLNKYILGTTVLTFSLFGAACSGIDTANEEMFHDNGNTINVNDQEELFNENVSDNSKKNGEDFGYVRQQKSPVQGQAISNKNMYRLDREKVADSISRMSVAIPNVDDCATLVTDEEVLISYKTDKKGKDERFNVADQVKKTALSVVPRWYHVYVTDDPNLMQNVENLAKMDSDSKNVNTSIDDTIDLMLKASPQGKDVSTGENANGEMLDEQYMGEDDVHQINKTNQKRIDKSETLTD
jgi:Sporulation lipoprotein YhcN/YlaJ (Spore_YhcN_YlaJ)